MTTLIMPVCIVAGVGALSGLLLSAAAKYMAVPTDERVGEVRESLPGANCGACGFAGCDEYAKQLVQESAPTNLCTPGGQEVSRRLSELLGKEFASVQAKTAVVRCAGSCASTEYIMDYRGPQSCEACNYLYQGRGSCSHACLGFGDCVMVCQYGAIALRDGVAVVDKAKCTGCGMCARRCPNDLIVMGPADSEVYVACSSTDKGAFVRKVCTAGCIGCRRCEKVCAYGAVVITGNLASIDPEQCTGCGECVKVCPTGVIRVNICGARQNANVSDQSLT